MRIIIIIALIVSNLLSQDLFSEGVKWYDKRSDEIEGLYASNSAIDRAIKRFEKDLKNNQSKRTVVYLLQSYYFQGEYVFKDKKSRKRIFNKGKEIAEKYIHIYPDSAEIRYWYLVNLGS